MLEADNEHIRTLDIDFDWLDDKQVLIQLLKVSKSIVNLHLAISTQMTPQDLNDITEVIMEHKTIQRLTFTRTRFIFDTITIQKFAELLLASKIPDHVTFAIKIKMVNPQSEEQDPSPIFENSDLPVLLDLVAATKCAKLAIWTYGDELNLDTKFICDYILAGKVPTLTALIIDGRVPTSEHWIRLLHHTTTLKTFKKTGSTSRNIGDFESEYFRALEKCQVRVLGLPQVEKLKDDKNFYKCLYQALKNNKFVEKLILTQCDQHYHHGAYFEALLHENDTINFLEIFVYDYERYTYIIWPGISVPFGASLVDAVKTNQSIIGINVGDDILGAENYDDLAQIMQGNQKLQNSAVWTVIAIIYNMARDKNSLGIIPLEIWSIIFSWIRIPGVALNFPSIFQSIFADSTVRRVIPRKKLRAYTDQIERKQK